ncbi:uncharacterized protein LOC126969487 [Leptidea sinapis]|uniref:uncharacterized protein LOC126969487 n=1 Tax=Leptidea sinapis TaxID=189913 RepID=UPI00212D55F2|nr:uncharacterized protein LOC126969487 [Leptidea sinapis]XP_050670909.1 uncharacterized protein LOC126969487 [Leptidea sinapis]
MDVNELNLISIATSNVDRYLNRGGDGQGDKPQLLKGTQLLNTIGMAMGLPLCDPAKWTPDELRRAENGDLCFFREPSLKAIVAIVETIKHCCDGDSENFVTVLPVELYFQSKLYELPIFRVSRYRDSHRYFVDNTGRYYKSFDDWYNYNKLPLGLMLYPSRLVLSAKSDGHANYTFEGTPSSRPSSITASVIDSTSAAVGIGTTVGLLFATGGLVAPLIIASVASAAWSTGRASYQLADKGSHGEDINPITDSESRLLWLGLAANIANFVATGASMRISTIVARSHHIPSMLGLVNTMAKTSGGTLSSVAMIENFVNWFLHKDTDNLITDNEVLLHCASVAFWTKGEFRYRTSSSIMQDLQDQVFNQIYSELPQAQRDSLPRVREVVQNDVSLIRQFYDASQSNISIQEFTTLLVARHCSP